MTGRVIEFAPIAQPRSWLDRVLRGSELSSVEYSGDAWSFGIGAHGQIATAGLWRVLTSDGVKVTSEDRGQSFGRPEPIDLLRILTETLTGPIWSVEISRLTADLRLDFREAALEFVSTSSGYEAWRLATRLDGEDLELVATGGGRLAVPSGQRD